MTQVIVIGAGISGLCAAKYLNERDIDVVVLEARDRVGGRTYTIQNPKVGYVDLGGSYVGVTQDRILRVSKELGVENYVVNESEKLVYYSKGKRWLHQANTMPWFWNPLANMDLNNLIRKIDEMGDTIPTHAPWECPHAEKWDKMTFQQFLDQTCWTNAAKDVGRILMSLIVTTEPYEGSLLWYLWYLKQCGGFSRTISTSNGGQERKFKGGSNQISIRLADLLKDRVHLSSPVVHIKQDDNQITVRTLHGKEYTTQYVIMALAPTLQGKIHYEPQLPPLKNQLVQRCPMGSVMKCILYYKTPFWREKGYCGSTFIVPSDVDHIVATFDDTKPDGNYPAIVGFKVADSLRKCVRLTPDERRDYFARCLANIFKTDEALNVVHYEEFNWMGEQYSGGCYTPMYGPGFMIHYGSEIRTPFGRIHYAGTETAIKWSGYMDGAVEAGERASREILHQMGKIPQEEIWQTEPPSKEVFARPFHASVSEKVLPSVSGFLRLTFALGVIGLASFVILRRKNCPFLERLASRYPSVNNSPFSV